MRCGNGALTRQLIEREIKQKDVDARLAEQPKETPFSMVGNKLTNSIFRHIPRLGYPGDLE